VVLAVAPEEAGLLTLAILPLTVGKDQTVSGGAWSDHAGTELTAEHAREPIADYFRGGSCPERP
jgi:hypothetical protein